MTFSSLKILFISEDKGFDLSIKGSSEMGIPLSDKIASSSSNSGLLYSTVISIYSSGFKKPLFGLILNWFCIDLGPILMQKAANAFWESKMLL